MNRRWLNLILASAICLAVSAAPAQAAFASSSNGGSFWIPYFATPASSGGKAGLLIVPSNDIESSTATHWITSVPTGFVGIAYQATYENGSLARYLPATLMYYATGADGQIRIFGLNLSNTSAVPKPFQIGSMALPRSSKQICSSLGTQTSLADPTTLFAVLEVAPAGKLQCGVAKSSYQVVHYTDSLATGPVITNLTSNLFYALYQNGSLKGLVQYDLLTQSVNLYASDWFKSPRVLLSGGIVLPVATSTAADGNNFGSTVLFLDELSFTGGGSTLYRIEASDLALSKVADAEVTIGAATTDKNSLYYADTTSPTETKIYQVALTGNTPKLLWSGQALPESSYYNLIQSDGKVLVFDQVQTPLPNGGPSNQDGATTTFYSVPVGKTSTTPTLLGGPYKGIGTGFVDQPTPTSARSTEKLFATLRSISGTATNQVVDFSTVSIPILGPYNPKAAAKTAYAGDAILNSTGIVLEVTGITDADGGLGGGKISQFEVGSSKSTVLKTTNGAEYVIPSGHRYEATLLGFFGDGIAAGVLYPESLTLGTDAGVVVDLSRSIALPISYSKTNVSIY
jgi:hypothetical protein